MSDEVDNAPDYISSDARGAAKAARAALSNTLAAIDCEDCGYPIPSARHAAYPGCTRCRDCQQIHEKETRGIA